MCDPIKASWRTFFGLILFGCFSLPLNAKPQISLLAISVDDQIGLVSLDGEHYSLTPGDEILDRYQTISIAQDTLVLVDLETSQTLIVTKQGMAVLSKVKPKRDSVRLVRSGGEDE